MRTLILSLLISLPAFACDLSFSRLNACATLHWMNGPVVNQESKLEIQFDQLPAGASFTLEALMQMGSHQHGTRPVVITPRSDASFLIEKLWFVMPGVWSLRAVLTDSTGLSEAAQIEVKL